MNNEERMQAMADGMILACACFLQNGYVSTEAVEYVLSEASITKTEFNCCDDDLSKKILLKFFNKDLTCLEDDKERKGVKDIENELLTLDEKALLNDLLKEHIDILNIQVNEHQKFKKLLLDQIEVATSIAKKLGLENTEYKAKGK